MHLSPNLRVAAVVLVLAVVMAPSPPVRAAEGADVHPSNLTIGLGQAASSLALTAGATAAIWALSGTSSDADGLLTLLAVAATPALAAGSVCGLGMLSSYRAPGRCWPVILSTLAVYPVMIGLIGLLFWDEGGPGASWSNSTQAWVLAGAWTLVPAALANSSWHLFKRPREPEIRAPLPPHAPTLGVARPWRRATAPGQLVLQLASVSF